MFLRLMLLIPLVRQFMLLDVSIMADGGEEYSEPPYKQLDELATLHARAMLHMNELGWPVGSLHRIPVGEKWIPGKKWYNRGHYETIYEDHFGASSFAGLLIMRSGTVYGYARAHYQRGGSERTVQLDFALINLQTREYLIKAFEHMLSLRPEPVYIDT